MDWSMTVGSKRRKDTGGTPVQLGGGKTRAGRPRHYGKALMNDAAKRYRRDACSTRRRKDTGGTPAPLRQASRPTTAKANTLTSILSPKGRGGESGFPKPAGVRWDVLKTCVSAKRTPQLRGALSTGWEIGVMNLANVVQGEGAAIRRFTEAPVQVWSGPFIARATARRLFNTHWTKGGMPILLWR